MIFSNKTLFGKNKTYQRSAGFTLSEIIIAISILSFGIVIVYGTFSALINVTSNVSTRLTGSYLAQEGLEIVRNIRDNNFIASINNPSVVWSAGLTGSPCSTGCQADYKSTQLVAYTDSFLGLNSDNFFSYDAGSTPSVYKRKITISPVQGTTDVLYVDVLVTWSYNGNPLSFETGEYLYNWF